MEGATDLWVAGVHGETGIMYMLQFLEEADGSIPGVRMPCAIPGNRIMSGAVVVGVPLSVMLRLDLRTTQWERHY